MFSSTSATRLGHHDPGAFPDTSVSSQATKVDSYLVPGSFKAYSRQSDNAKSWVGLYCKLKTASLGLKSLSRRADRKLEALYSEWQQQEQAAQWLHAQLAVFPCLDTSLQVELLYEKIDADAELASAAKSARIGRSRKELASLHDEKNDCARKLHAECSRLEELETRRAHAKEKARSRHGRHDTHRHIEPSRSSIRSAREKVAKLDGDIAVLEGGIAELQSWINEQEAALEPHRQAVAGLAVRLRAAGVSEQEETAIKPLMQRLDEVRERQDQLGWTLQLAEEPPRLLETGEVVFFGQHSKAQLKHLLATVRAELQRTEDFIEHEIKRLKLSRTPLNDRRRSTTFRPLTAADFLSSQGMGDYFAAQDQDRGAHASQAAIGETTESVVVAASSIEATGTSGKADSDGEQVSGQERDAPQPETALVCAPAPASLADSDASSATDDSSEAEDSDGSVESSEETDSDDRQPDAASISAASMTGQEPLHDLPRPVAPALPSPAPEPHSSRYHYSADEVDSNWTRWPQERVDRPLPPREVSEDGDGDRGPLLLGDRPLLKENEPAAESSRNAGSYAFSAAQLRQWGRSDVPRPAPASRPAATDTTRQGTANPGPAKPKADRSRARHAAAPSRATPSSTSQALPLDRRIPYTWSGEWHYLPRFMAEQLTMAVRNNMAWTTIRHSDLIFPQFGVLKDFYLVRDNLENGLEFRLNPGVAAKPITYSVRPGDARFHVLEILPLPVAWAEPPPFYPGPGSGWRQPPSRSRRMGGPGDPLHFYSTDPWSPRYRAPSGGQEPPVGSRHAHASEDRPRDPRLHEDSGGRRPRYTDRKRTAGTSRGVSPARRAAMSTQSSRIDVVPIILRNPQGKRSPGVDLLGAALRQDALRKASAGTGRSSKKDVLRAMQAIMDDASLFTRSAYPEAFASLANATRIIDELRAKGFDLRMLHELQEDLAYPRLKGTHVDKPAGFALAFNDSDSDDDYRSYLRQKYLKVFSFDITDSIFEQMLGRIQNKLGHYIAELGAESLLEEVVKHDYSAEQKQSLLHDLVLQRGEMTERAVDAVPAFKQKIEERVNEKLLELERTDPDKVRTVDHRRAQQDNLRKAVLAQEAAAMHDEYLRSSAHAELVLPVKSQFPANVWRTVIGKAIPALEKEDDAD